MFNYRCYLPVEQGRRGGKKMIIDYLLLIIVAKFRPKAMVVENKNWKFEIFFIPYKTKTYG
jgi:hypothetical protein